MARHSHPPSLAVGGKSGKEHRITKPEGGNGTHQTSWKRETAGALGTIAQTVQHKGTQGNADLWEQLAENKVQWLSFCDLFVEFVETQVLRADTRATLARDALAIRQEDNEQ